MYSFVGMLKYVYICKMFEISDHIEYLLTQHDCVIVPELGAFIARYRSAVFSSDKQSVSPPVRLIGFNPELIHNDGLLAGSLSRVKNISFEEACLLIGQEVDEIKRQLTAASEKIVLGALGTLSLNPEGHLLFDPKEEIPFLTDSFGMEPVEILPLAALYKEEPAAVSVRPHNPDVYYIPVSKRFVRRVAAAVAVIVMLMSISTPIDDANAPINYAGLISSGFLETTPLSPDRIDRAIQAEEELTHRSESVPVRAESPEIAVPAAVKTDSVPVSAGTAPVAHRPKTGNGKRYYIIVASLPTREAAVQQQSNFKKMGIQETEILDNGSKVRLYIDSFSDKRQAEEYLETVRSSSPHLKNAWLLAARNRSV